MCPCATRNRKWSAKYARPRITTVHCRWNNDRRRGSLGVTLNPCGSWMTFNRNEIEFIANSLEFLFLLFLFSLNRDAFRRWMEVKIYNLERNSFESDCIVFEHSRVHSKGEKEKGKFRWVVLDSIDVSFSMETFHLFSYHFIFSLNYSIFPLSSIYNKFKNIGLIFFNMIQSWSNRIELLATEKFVKFLQFNFPLHFFRYIRGTSKKFNSSKGKTLFLRMILDKLSYNFSLRSYNSSNHNYIIIRYPWTRVKYSKMFLNKIQFLLIKYSRIQILVLETKLQSIFINVENETSPLINRISLMKLTHNRLEFEMYNIYIHWNRSNPIHRRSSVEGSIVSKDRSMSPRNHHTLPHSMEGPNVIADEILQRPHARIQVQREKSNPSPMFKISLPPIRFVDPCKRTFFNHFVC